MSVRIGVFLTRLREEAGVSQKELCEGICKLSAYSNYERDERVPDFLTLNLLLERLGMGIVGMAAYLAKEEAEYLEWRSQTAQALCRQNFAELAKLTSQEPVACTSLNENIRRQYTLYLCAVLEETKGKTTAALKLYEEALRLTCPSLLKESLSSFRISKTEIGIYSVYLRLLTEEKKEERKRAAKKLEILLEYVEKQVSDPEEQVKSFPHLVCIWVQVLGKQGNHKKKEKLLSFAYELLKSERKLYHVTEVLRLLIAVKEGQGKDFSREQKDYNAICELYKFFDKGIEFNHYEISENIWMFTMIGDYLSKSRRKKDLTQEEISDGICAVESYSRIESGKRAPNRRNYQALANRLEIEPRYFLEILNTDNPKAIRLRRKVSEALFQDDYVKGRELLQELEKELGPEREKNIQYLEERYAACDCGMRAIPVDERLRELKRILSHTLDIEDIGKNNHIYIRTEINLINQMAAAYQKKKEYEKGIQLLQGFLDDMKHSKITLEQRFRETYLAALNLDKLLTDIGRFEEGNELCMKWGRMAVYKGHAVFMDDYLAEISFNLDNMQKNTSEYTKKLCEVALDISDVYGTKKKRIEICDYYKARYQR